MEDKGFDFNLYIINNAVFSKCPYDVLTKIEEYKNDPYYKYAVLLNRVMNHGYNNQEAIRELIELTNETEYTKPHYRAPIILLVVINIDLKFNPAEPMEKFEVGGKTYFRPKKKD
ncbi:hypothetical protein [Flavobacterium sp. CS20]|nr:hypothetical protein [Flavobacterium sp. CS20]QTY27601.1 hypothetical protein IGB25_03385 [Flavobacterium sp. CS20]